MLHPMLRPRITDFIKISELVIHLRREGLDSRNIARRITEIGVVDLDMLQEVMREV